MRDAHGAWGDAFVQRRAACCGMLAAGQDGRTGMTDLVQLKAEARAAAFAARKAAFQRGQGQAAEILADVLAAHRGKVLAGCTCSVNSPF